MSTATRTTVESPGVVLNNVPWSTYVKTLQLYDERPGLRLTYDRGTLEIMTLSLGHEKYSFLLARFVVALTEEMSLPIESGGSATMKRRKARRGLEPDKCFWIANEHRIRGKDKIDLRTDPPPDLAIEIDVTSNSIDRMAIYARLGVPEVWRHAGSDMTFHTLGDRRRYSTVPCSPTFPFLTPADLLRFLALRPTMDENAVVREFRAWVRTQVNPA